MHSIDLRDVGYASERNQRGDRTSGGRLRLLRAWDFIGYPNLTMANATSYVIDNATWTCDLAANGGAEFLQGSGLHLTRTVSSSGQTSSVYTSDLQRAVGFNRWWMGNFQHWMYLSSYTFTGSAVAMMNAVYGSSPAAHGTSFRRSKNVNGGANTADGSIIPQYFWNGADTSPASSPLAVTPANVWMVNYRTPWRADYWYGTWSTTTGWPKAEDMTLLGQAPFGDNLATNNRSIVANFTSWIAWYGLYATGIADAVIERARITTFE